MNKFRIQLLALLAVLFGFSMAISGCERELEAELQNQKATLQADGDDPPTSGIIPCDSANGDDVDISGGFIGQVTQNSGTGQAEFTIDDFSAMFPLQGYVQGDVPCVGYCGCVVKFVAEEPGENFVPPILEGITLNYLDGTNQLLSAASNYTWAFPYLTIESVVSSGIGNYEIDFEGEHISGLNVETVYLDGGLCVVDNIDKTDPLIRIVIIPNHLDL